MYPIIPECGEGDGPEKGDNREDATQAYRGVGAKTSQTGAGREPTETDGEVGGGVNGGI